jgi:aspartate--ammonia ligase
MSESEKYIKALESYTSALDLKETQIAIEFIKDHFSRSLRQKLNLRRASAPLFVSNKSGLNDDLGGQGHAVTFTMPHCPDEEAEIVQSLAKWKRFALKRYNFKPGEGIVTDMNAIRKDESLDALHSIYVDQWDWEKVISEEDRTLSYLEDTVSLIAQAIFDTSYALKVAFSGLERLPSADVAFISSQELEDLYPDVSGSQREYLFAKDHTLSFVTGIGGKLRSGKPHGPRAADYDDWALNGDLLYYDKAFDRVIELSSMGIRVSPQSLLAQLKAAGEEAKLDLPYHRALSKGQLPLTIGGGIGQSRLCMVLLQKAHVGEVQSSIWDKASLEMATKYHIQLL